MKGLPQIVTVAGLKYVLDKEGVVATRPVRCYRLRKSIRTMACGSLVSRTKGMLIGYADWRSPPFYVDVTKSRQGALLQRLVCYNSIFGDGEGLEPTLAYRLSERCGYTKRHNTVMSSSACYDTVRRYLAHGVTLEEAYVAAMAY